MQTQEETLVRAQVRTTNRSGALRALNREREYALEERNGFGALRAERLMAVIRLGGRRVIYGGVIYQIRDAMPLPGRRPRR